MKKLCLSCPEDLIAAAPSLLGFHPHDSVVLLAAGRPSFPARVDLPPSDPPRPDRTDAGVDDVVALLTGPVARHGVAAVVLLYFCADHARALRVHQPLLRALQEGGVRVPEALHVTPTHYASLIAPGPPRWQPYDVGGHPLLAEAVFEGRQIQPDRAALAAEVSGDREAARAIGAALARARFAPARAEAAWAARTVADLVEDDVEPDELAPSHVEEILGNAARAARDHLLDVRLLDDRVDVDAVDHLVHVDPIEHPVDVDARHHPVHVDPIEHRVDIDAVEQRIDVDARHHRVDVDVLEQFVDVDPFEDGVDVDPLDEVVGLDRVHHRADDRPDQLVQRRLGAIGHVALVHSARS
jgi:hypothetical protein